MRQSEHGQLEREDWGFYEKALCILQRIELFFFLKQKLSLEVLSEFTFFSNHFSLLL